MKLKLHGITGVLLSVAGSCALLQSAQAQFTDQNSDLILIMRKVTAGDLGAVDFEVDLGPASTYYNTPANTTVDITQYTTAQLDAAFPDAYAAGNLNWSVSGSVPLSGGDPNKPVQTLWMTDPRPLPTTPPGTVWQRKSTYQQGPTALKIATVLYNAKVWGGSVPADAGTNTPTEVAITTGTEYCADPTLTAVGNYTTFQGDIENTTPALFAYFTTPSRSDFYELQPGSGAGTYLGYFQLAPDGSLTYNTLQASYPVPVPMIALNNSGATVVISYQSAAGGTYTLYSNNTAGLSSPVTGWSAVGGSITGDGTVQSFPSQPIVSGAATYYVISVH
jgi:hypothetical protein